MQELKEEVLEMAEIEIKAVERMIGETEVGVCSCGPTLNDRVTSFLLFQVFFLLFFQSHTCEKQTQTTNKHSQKVFQSAQGFISNMVI